MSYPNSSADLVWQIVNKQNAFLVKRRQAGGVVLSRDPLNLTNKHSFKYSGFVTDKAIGILPGRKGGVIVETKRAGKANAPAAGRSISAISRAGPRKTYKKVAGIATKDGYRADLRAAAVARAAAIKKSQASKQKPVAPKLRGAKARKAAE